MLEPSIVGLTGDGKEMLVAFLLHLHALVYRVKLSPSLRVQIFLLMREQLQILV
jgi:hypothetical protein